MLGTFAVAYNSKVAQQLHLHIMRVYAQKHVLSFISNGICILQQWTPSSGKAVPEQHQVQ